VTHTEHQAGRLAEVDRSDRFLAGESKRFLAEDVFARRTICRICSLWRACGVARITASTFGSSSAVFKSGVIGIPSSSPTSLAAAAFGSTARTSSISRDCLFIRAPIFRPHQPSPTNATPTIPSSPILQNLLAAFSRWRVQHDDQRRCEMVLMVDDLAHFVRRDCPESIGLRTNPSTTTLTLPTRETYTFSKGESGPAPPRGGNARFNPLVLEAIWLETL
jgi:hypothetical protein